MSDKAELIKMVQSCTGTKFISHFSGMLIDLSLDAVATVYMEDGGRKELDIKR
jgi:T-complex protein 1 subunit gamma